MAKFAFLCRNCKLTAVNIDRCYNKMLDFRASFIDTLCAIS